MQMEKMLLALGASTLVGLGAHAAVVTQYSFENGLTDTAAGGTVADNLTEAQGTASYVAGVVGSAVVFDQAAGLGLLEAADSADDIAAGGTWTMELFVNTTTLNAGFNRLLLKWDTDPFDNLSFHMSINGGGVDLFQSSGGDLGSFSQPIVGATTAGVAPVLADGQWHHLAITNDSSDGTAGLNAYVDGVLVSTGAGLSIFDGSDVLGIGDFRDNTGDAYNGLIDEVLFHDAAVDQAYIDSRVALIPEPGSLALLGLGGLLIARRRRA